MVTNIDSQKNQKKMKIKYSKIIPFKGYFAINLFGTVFVRAEKKDKVEKHPQWYATTWNHEAIHTEQMKETLYIGFYLLYLLFWIIRLLTPPMNTAYKDISFEQEAYLNENNLEYIKTRRPYAWIKYQFTSFRKSKEIQS